ncbi:MAG: patatin-like phospholipase family protein [Variovorax sp.]
MARPPQFELGLSLAGGVSCGAFTAGAIDFIVEALDAWQDALERHDADAPAHRVVLRTVMGASSGALTTAVLGAALPYDIPPVRPGTSYDDACRNPLFESWVHMTGLDNLLDTRDAASGSVRSLLDPTRLEGAARKAIEFGQRAAPRLRRWLPDPFRVAFSVTNLRGVRYPMLHAGRAATPPHPTVHGELLCFALTGLGDGSHPQPARRADEKEIAVGADPAAAWDRWGHGYATAALASAAFPLLLPARPLQHLGTDARELQIVLRGGACAPDEVVVAAPAGVAGEPRDRAFDGVDGGLIDNDPVDAVRAELNDRDPLACNPRDGLVSDRAVLMVNPLLGNSASAGAPWLPTTLGNALPRLLSTLLHQAHLRVEDIALATREDVYSRFLIAPHAEADSSTASSGNLAGGSLGGLGGYLCREFRLHDYRLGRRNAQQALATHLLLPEDNPLFADWTTTQRAHYAAGDRELPIIPLVGRLHPRHGEEEPSPDWPRGQADPAAFGPAFDRRLDVVYRHLVPWWARWLLAPLWHLFVRRRVRNGLVEAMVTGLRQHGLS